MIKYNRLLSASVVLMLTFAMPGMPDLVTWIYAASSVPELLDKYLDDHKLLDKYLDDHKLLDKYLDDPIFRHSDRLPYNNPSSSPQSPPSVLSESVQNTLVYSLTSSETRTILPIQMQLPDGTWSQPVKYNFDTGASWPTDVAPQFLPAFGYGPDGVGSDSSNRHPQPGKIRIVGLDKEIDLPVMVQDKAHYDLFRDQPPPTRYPLVNVADILTQISMVFASDQTTLRLK